MERQDQMGIERQKKKGYLDRNTFNWGANSSPSEGQKHSWDLLFYCSKGRKHTLLVPELLGVLVNSVHTFQVGKGLLRVQPTPSII